MTGRAELHVILVETADSLNIGSVARAMSNFGLDKLHLVSPKRFDRGRAKITACWADGLLDTLQVWDDLDAAISGMDEVVGFSTRSGKNLPDVCTLAEYRRELDSSPARNVALLFGAEEAGLSRESMERCRHLIRIPSQGENPSLNLAQAVVVALYELWDVASFDGAMPEELATASQYRALDLLVDELLQSSRFIEPGSQSELPGLLHSMARRIRPNQREMQILLGVAREIKRVFDSTKSKPRSCELAKTPYPRGVMLRYGKS